MIAKQLQLEIDDKKRKLKVIQDSIGKKFKEDVEALSNDTKEIYTKIGENTLLANNVGDIFSNTETSGSEAINIQDKTSG